MKTATLLTTSLRRQRVSALGGYWKTPLVVRATRQHAQNRFLSHDTKTEDTVKQTVVSKWDGSKKYWMSNTEYTGVVVGKEATGGEYVITDGVIGPGGFVPDHYHKWEDQTFHVITGELQAKIGNETYQVGPGDTIHCPRGVSHFIENTGDTEVKLISYIFPGHWAEDFMAETSRQNHEGNLDLKLIEDKFGVVYI
ncbi:Cupin 2, conserved barrel [Seminavis robusta]|uniref:Cupin 2, conserved barrel n=1 Tax=Seminavis robusta TaxID=568900 RepID=A0A9N8H2N3_9STRA|nr:Cupin 2, conserved barrel [Seminavis robusta]|eukprot:Sro40_g024650.1 Cupin 2, conserved barrel (196) ;mRNA; r:70496-71083